MLILWLLSSSLSAFAIAERPAPYNLQNATVYFEKFMRDYGKVYANTVEQNNRFEIFKKNLEIINRKNEAPDGAEFGIDETADLSAEEYKEMTSCLFENPNEYSSHNDVQCNVLTDAEIVDRDAPPAFNWRREGAVTDVRDQRNCRSCWAIVAAGQLEARNYMKHKKLIQLSPQQIVDCDTLSLGCHGGTMEQAYRSLIGKIGGCMTEQDYPYEAKKESCRSEKEKEVVIPLRCSTYNLTSQDKVRQQVHKLGPIGIAVRNDGLRFYHKGVFKDYQCEEGEINHAVLIVGYGTDEDEGDYWLVKNSHGTTFGENGYFRMQRGENNTSCGMMNKYMATATID